MSGYRFSARPLHPAPLAASQWRMALLVAGAVAFVLLACGFVACERVRAGLARCRRRERIGCAPIVGAAAAVALSGCGVLPSSATGGGPSFHAVEVGTRPIACWPVAGTAAGRQKGLDGALRAPHPLVLAYDPAQDDTYDLRRVRVPVTGVWVGHGWRVVSEWHGRAGARQPHRSPGPVWALIEFPRGTRAPKVGTRIVLGPGCKGDGQL